jgi:hypothetical protein
MTLSVTAQGSGLVSSRAAQEQKGAHAPLRQGSGITLAELVENLDLATETRAGKAAQWDL